VGIFAPCKNQDVGLVEDVCLAHGILVRSTSHAQMVVMSPKKVFSFPVTKCSQGSLWNCMAFDQCCYRLCPRDRVELWQDLHPNSDSLIFRLENAQNKRRLNYKMASDTYY